MKPLRKIAAATVLSLSIAASSVMAGQIESPGAPAPPPPSATHVTTTTSQIVLLVLGLIYR